MASRAKAAAAARDQSQESALLRRRPWLYPLLLVVVCGLLYFWRLGAVPLADFDEAYYAEGAREMMARGDLLTPHFNGQPFLLKPVLIYWIIVAAFNMIGASEFAARVGSAVFGTATVLATYVFAANTLGRRAALFAGLALALSYMWIAISRDASIDAPLAAALVPALFLFYSATRAPARRKRWLYLAFYALLGVALLAKGPIPVAVVLVGLLAYLVAAKRLRRTLREAHLLPGLALTLAIAAPWYVAELRAQPAFFETFFIGEHLGHIRGQLARTEPVWGNLRTIAAYFIPWALFLPAALHYAFRQHDRGHVLRFAAWWSIAVVVLFSIPKSKLAHYLAPAFPPMALLVGAWFDAWLAGKPALRAPAAVSFALLGAAGAICLGVAVCAAVPPPSLREAIAARAGQWTPGASAVVIPAALGAGLLAGAVLAWRWRALVIPSLVVGAMAAGMAYAGWFELRRAQIQAQPRKELAQYAAAVLPRSEPFGVFYAKRNSTIFYLGRPIVDLGEWEPAKLAAFLSSPRPAAALTHEKFLGQLARSGRDVHVLAHRGAYVLVANHPVAAQRTHG